ncbi:MAG: hypothetical protein IT376_22000 [Polyangiaceae bacterium]|nr:hypothetical protein [Polyangiaceae bacterium]
MSRWICSVRGARAAAAALVALVGASCSDPGGSLGEPAGRAALDASAPAPLGGSLALVERLAGPDPGLAHRVRAQAAGGWAIAATGFTSPGFRNATGGASYDVGARLGARADEALRVGIGASDEVTVTLLPVGAAPVEAELDGGRVVFRGAYPSTDIVHVADDASVEWFYVQHDDRAPAELVLETALGAGLAGARLENTGAWLFVDAADQALLRVSRPFVVDAKGARRDAGLDWAEGRLRIVVDREGLTYPLLVDPAIETAAWELRNGPPTARENFAIAYDSTRQRVMVFGGASAGALVGDTWAYDGTTWVLRSTVGPSARQGAMMEFDAARGRLVLFGGEDAGGIRGDTWLWDGTTWTETCTGSCTHPTARSDHMMSYDSARQRVVLFGGNAGSYQNDTWEWNGTTWSLRASSGPPVRVDGAMTYDSTRGETVLFSGVDFPFVYLNDTWTWNGTSWTQKAVTNPTARWGAAFSHHVDTGRTVLFGGLDSTSSIKGDTWEWNGTSWTQKSPATSPGERFLQGSAYSAALHRVVLFAGSSRGDTWEWNGTDWSEPTTVPAPRREMAMAYDASRSRTVLFGGDSGSATVRRDTWEWDGFGWLRTCTQPPCSSTLPSARTGHGMTYDSTRQRVVLFGGYALNDTWEYTGTAWTEMCNTFPCNGTLPSQRNYFAMAYDTVRQHSLVFGGVATPDLWAWNGTAWSERCTSGACQATRPAARNFAAFAFDSTRGVAVLFGGADYSSGTALGDLWEWNGTAWSQKCTGAPCNTNRPSPRSWSQLAWDETRGRTVLVGGADGGGNYLDDSWEWDGTAWIKTGPAAVGAVPAKRYGHTMVHDRVRRRTVIFGGGTFNGTRLGDTWEYHLRGNGCSVGMSCSTGFCVDGVCCESSLCGTCQACDLASSPGLCAAVTDAEDPDSCSGTNRCDAQGQCKKKEGQGCSGAGECASGYCSDGYCCDAACTGGCDRCNSPAGTCTRLAAGNGGSNPSCGGFACTGSSGACPTSCTTDAQCTSGYFCASGGTCQLRRAQGTYCNTAAGGDCATAGCGECLAGLTCADNVCCASACSGTCQTCNGSTPGTCQTLTSGQDPGTCTSPNECTAAGTCKKQNGTACAGGSECASGVCVASACQPASCTTDAQCTAAAYCRTSDGTCQPDQALGGACATGSQCSSGNCADGYCCSSACTGACQACSAGKTGGTNGTCAAVAVGTDPDNECALDLVGTCQRDGACDGVGACRLYATGTVCGAPTCSSGTLVSSTCTASHTCSASSVGCSPYACDAGGTACRSSCTADTHCAAGNYCRTGGTCASKLANGVACGGANECNSGYCADGVCCDAACNQPCQSCSAAKKQSGANGACGPTKGDTDPDADCAADGSTCGQTGNCNGSGACKLASVGTVCGTTTCANALQTGQQCDGAGTCSNASSVPCAAGYACLSASVCATSCTDDTQCAAGYFCGAGNACVPAQPTGATCDRARQCANAYCVDGYCCNGQCAGTCQACSAAKTGSANGTCAPVQPATDPDNECAATPQATCQENGACDGAGACKKWAFGTSCGSSSCVGAVQTGQVCDGSGTCTNGQSVSCAVGYVCATATSCATSCTGDAQCAALYYCRTSDSTCQPRQANGAACSTGTQCTSGSCVDGVCCDTACTGACQACTTAKKGSGANGQCGAVSAGSDPDAECAQASPSTCAQNGACDGSGACQKYSAGTSCGATTCTAGSGGLPDQQSGASCDGFGACLPANVTSCGRYRCAGSACGTTCNVDGECIGSAFCDTTSHTCVDKRATGAACGAAGQCASGFCVDGVCCGQACAGTCQACTAARKGAGADGECGPVGAGTDPDLECADQGSSSCGTNGTCNGFGACALYGAGTACGATTCTPDTVTGGTQTGSTCNGSGVCVASSTSACAPYVCQGAACGAACLADTDCIASHFCDTVAGTCLPDGALGGSCTLASQCQSGQCVDGVCCDSPCSGTCQACSATRTGGADGTCASVAAETDPDDECPDDGPGTCARRGVCAGSAACALYAAGVACGATTCTAGSQQGQACDGYGTCQAGQQTSCGLFQCKGSACGTTCSVDDDCVGSAHCDTASGTCAGDLGVGGTCSRDSECQSGHCADGVCCDTGCTAGCQACSAARKGQGGDGTCGAIAAGLDPDDECAAASPTSCGSDGACDGAGACRNWLPGTACGVTTCGGAVGSVLTGAQCDGFGACQSSATTDCAPYVCLGSSSCPTTCLSSAECIPGTYCAADSTCQGQQDLGAACTSAGECKSGFCVEGVCCNTLCDGKCQACTAANQESGTDGLCGNARVGVDPHNDCTAESVTTCGLDGTCDGNGACSSYAAGTACGATACDGNTQTGYACDGLGTCDSDSTVPCGVYACAGGACKSSCAADGDCAAAAWCDLTTSVCLPRSPNGEPCTEARTCATGLCVDGVCCDAACGGQCEACDLPTALGKCSPVIGEPHGVADGRRTACPAATGTSPNELCQARTCDGTRDVTTCVGFVGTDVACRDQACSEGVETFSAACNGQGACDEGDGAVRTKRCAPFQCLDDRTCRDTCAADTDCQAGSRCDPSGQCVSSTTCDGDHTLTSPTGETTDCSPFKCDQSGACIPRCRSTEDCVAPAVCNGDAVCVQPSRAAAADDGGCGCRAAGGAPRTPRTAWLAALAAALALGAARRRGRRLNRAANWGNLA